MRRKNRKMHSHRPTSSHQTNKPFKSRHKTKGNVKASDGGKIARPNANNGPRRKSVKDSKVNKKNAVKMHIKKTKEGQNRIRRMFFGRDSIPKTGVIISLDSNTNPDIFLEGIHRVYHDKCSIASNDNSKICLPVNMELNVKQKQKLQWLCFRRNTDCSNSEVFLMNILDACKVADFIVFLLSAHSEIDQLSYTIISALKAQGNLPSYVVCQNMESIPPKKQSDVKKVLASFVTNEISQNNRVWIQESDSDISNLIRHICDLTPMKLSWRDSRPYMLADEIQFLDSGHLKVTGYCRGHPFNADRLVHIPTYGDFQLEQIVDETNGMVYNHEHLEQILFENLAENNADEDMLIDEKVLEQSAHFPTRILSQRKKVPIGTSSYQAEWMIDSETELSEDNESIATQDQRDILTIDTEMEINGDFDSFEVSEHEEPNSEGEDDIKYEDYIQNKKNYELPEDYLEFPDEVDTPTDIPARLKFRKYRGLKSFRTSAWDPYENLPTEYGKIFQFESFELVRKQMKQVLKEEYESKFYSELPSENEDRFNGPYTLRKISLIIRNVPSSLNVFMIETQRPLTVFGLLPHEEKMSVLNLTFMQPSKTPGSHLIDEENQKFTVKSKDHLIIQCGFRRYTQQVTISQHSNGNLHKVEKYAYPGSVTIASVYGQIHLNKDPVLYFRPTLKNDSFPQYLGSGTLLSVDPNRMLIKRKILTGIPTRIHPSHHRNTAVIKFMFFNEEDITYFKPIELKTKLGRRGHILSSIGTHGTMKCGFDKPLKSMDTVCLPLYKRVYPKWPVNGYQSLFGEKVAEEDLKKLTNIVE